MSEEYQEIPAYRRDEGTFFGHSMGTNVQGQDLNWTGLWDIAINNPSEKTFETIASYPGRSHRIAWLWIFATSLGSIVIFGLIGAIIAMFMGNTSFMTSVSWLMEALVGGFIASISNVLRFIVWAALIHRIASWMGGVGKHVQLSFSFAAFIAPLMIIAILISIIPCVNFLVLGLVVYQIYLSMLVVKSIHKLDWKKSTVAVLVSSLLVIMLEVGITSLGIL